MLCKGFLVSCFGRAGSGHEGQQCYPEAVYSATLVEGERCNIVTRTACRQIMLGWLIYVVRSLAHVVLIYQ